MGYETDIFGLGSLLLAALATAGTGYLLYDHINKNKAADEQRKYEAWIAQQQALQNQQMVQNSQPVAKTENDMIDMNTVSASPAINYDRFLDRGVPLSSTTAPPKYQVNAQPPKVDVNAEPVVDMNQYGVAEAAPNEMIVPTQEKKRDATTDELMAAMYNYDYGSS